MKVMQSGATTRHERYLYRGYLQLAALNLLDATNVIHAITWDPTEPVATRPLALQRGTNGWSYGFDQVKNVTELFDSTGALAAAYDYAPFGALTSATGPAATLNPLTFSSEIHDSPLGLIYYNFRHLNVLDGRWVNRDPINENGGLNFYVMVYNAPIWRFDKNGLSRHNGGGNDVPPVVIDLPPPRPSPSPTPPQESTDSILLAFFRGFVEGLRDAVTSPEYLRCQGACSLDVTLNSINPLPFYVTPGNLVYRYGSADIVDFSPSPSDVSEQIIVGYYAAALAAHGGQFEINRMTELLERRCSKIGERHRRVMEQKLRESLQTQNAVLKAKKLTAALVIVEATVGFWDCYENKCKRCLESCTP
jgi:RHS repeat-associated protein